MNDPHTGAKDPHWSAETLQDLTCALLLLSLGTFAALVDDQLERPGWQHWKWWRITFQFR
jgi:hypothetical protein